MLADEAVTQEIERQASLTIDGKQTRLQEVSPTLTLLEYLRLKGYVGTKEGCADGDCGACTVALVGKNPNGQPHYQAVNSCLIPLGAVVGREIITVEGVANGSLHPVQAAMVETGGSQCGYCTPGFIMSLFAAYYDRKVDDACVEGNLCRCTGYLPIRRAAQQVAQELPGEDHFSQQLAQSTPDLAPLSYQGNQQQFHRPTSLPQVLELFQQYPDAELIAGGTDLGLEFSHHRKHISVLISLEAVTELQQLQQMPEWVEIGAAVPLSHIEETLRGTFPALDEMLYWFAARQVRNRATIGGNIGTASPIGDLPPVLLALDAEVRLASANGERVLPLANFFKGYRQTERQPNEVIVSVKIPKTWTPGSAVRLSQSYKVGKRGTDDISIVAATFTIDLDDRQHILHARLAYGGVAATPARAIAVEEMLVGKPWNLATVQQVKPILRTTFTPLTDLRGSAEYRQLLVANLFEKFFVEMADAMSDLAEVSQ
ncbi:xanthine dehydrogenase small subunit [Egbenema bharatensis]|uniref:xanthine dehydrogenase small subunit n=1 Tax=Egbenema bharatensis TaxID=3463334 RepID=UPI003A8537FB